MFDSYLFFFRRLCFVIVAFHWETLFKIYIFVQLLRQVVFAASYLGLHGLLKYKKSGDTQEMLQITKHTLRKQVYLNKLNWKFYHQ